MLCPKCQTKNADDAKTCSKCGESLSKKASSAANTSSKASEVRAEATNFFSFAVSAMLKPVTTLRNKLQSYDSFKSAGIATLIVAVVSMLVSLLTAMLSAVVVRKFTYGTGKYKTSLDFSNLGEVHYFKLIFFGLVIYIAVVAIIALVFFGASRIFKRPQTNYWRMLTVTVIASIPVVIASLLAPIFSLLHVTLGVLISLVGWLYTFYIFYEGINAEADITGDNKVFFNLVSTVILIVVTYIIVRLLLEDTMASGSLDLTKMLDF